MFSEIAFGHNALGQYLCLFLADGYGLNVRQIFAY